MKILRWQCVYRGTARHGPCMALLVAILGLCVGGFGSAAQLGAAEVQILPEHPTEGSGIVLVMSGTWTDSCVPRLSDVRIAGKLSSSPRRARQWAVRGDRHHGQFSCPSESSRLARTP